MYIKKYYQYIEFTLISVFFILPPLFAKPIKNFNFSSPFSIAGLVYFLVALILYFQESRFNTIKQKKSFLLQSIMNSSYFFKTFGSLVAFAAILEVIMIKINSKSAVRLNFADVNKFNVICSFLITCFYEEVMYRLYFPQVLNRFYDSLCNLSFYKKEEKIIRPLIEFTAILVFALSHRYMGIAATINALFAGFMLRWCCIKTSSVLTGYCAHFLYNVFMFLLLFFIPR